MSELFPLKVPKDDMFEAEIRFAIKTDDPQVAMKVLQMAVEQLNLKDVADVHLVWKRRVPE